MKSNKTTRRLGRNGKNASGYEEIGERNQMIAIEEKLQIPTYKIYKKGEFG